MSKNYSLSKDLKEAETMASGFESYLRGDQIYGQTGGVFSSDPSLTVGALLMRLRRLDELRDEMDAGQSKKLDKIQDMVANVRQEWTMHYEEKLTAEAKSRLDAMRGFFKECADSMQTCANVYAPEMLRRTIVQEIMREVQARNLSDSDLDDKLRTTDGKLRGYVSPADFQWDDTLQPVYSRSEYWWLYHRPQPSAS